MIIAICLSGLLLFIAGYIISCYNNLVIMDQRIKQSFADIDVQLKQRHNLIPNLVETVKGYATHENSTLEDVMNARSGAVNPRQGTVEQALSENMLTQALGRLFAVTEAYPDLKANINFQRLHDELSDIENKIAASRRYYNNTVSEFNSYLDLFPINLFSRGLGFHTREFFDLGDQRATFTVAPTVKFN